MARTNRNKQFRKSKDQDMFDRFEESFSKRRPKPKRQTPIVQEPTWVDTVYGATPADEEHSYMLD